MGNQQEIVIPDEHKPGAAPGVSGAAVLAFLPKLMELIAAIKMGAVSVPQFTVRAFGRKAKIGPTPISYE